MIINHPIIEIYFITHYTIFHSSVDYCLGYPHEKHQKVINKTTRQICKGCSYRRNSIISRRMKVNATDESIRKYSINCNNRLNLLDNEINSRLRFKTIFNNKSPKTNHKSLSPTLFSYSYPFLLLSNQIKIEVMISPILS